MTIEQLTAQLRLYGADLDVINSRFMGDMAFYASCLEQFWTDTCINELIQAISDKDYAAAFVAAHTLKGLSGNMALTPIYKAVCDIVEPLRSGSPTNPELLLEQVTAEYNRAKALLSEQE